MTMTSLKVAVRVRPLTDKESIRGSKVVVDVCGRDILVTDVKVPGKHGCDHRLRVHRFTFDYGFWSVEPSSNKCASQRSVYEDFGRVVLNTLLSGYNSCVIAYGPSGSGKTYTMMGNKDDTGLTPRICEGLFTKLTDKSDQQTPFQIDISFMEIYNEQVFDLLTKQECQSNRKPKLRVREHPFHGPFVEGLSTHVVKNIDEVCDLLARGNEARVKADTHIHDRSSRSHAIFTIRCSQACLDADKPKEVISKLHLVDLAGSERAIPEFCPSRIKEGANINKSLVTLGNVISVLVELSKQGKTSHKQIYVPYRDSNLTWLLKDSLGGNSHTFMLAAVSPSKECYIETVSTLRYAQRAKLVLNTPVVNEDPSTEMIRNLRKEVAKLKNLLATAEGLSKGYVLKPLPEIRQLKSIMNESARRVDILTKHWFEKWLQTYDVVLKKFDIMESTGDGIAKENENFSSCTSPSHSVSGMSLQSESSECVVVGNECVGFFKQKHVEQNTALIENDIQATFSHTSQNDDLSSLSREGLQVNSKPLKDFNGPPTLFAKSCFKSFSNPNVPRFLRAMEIDDQRTSSHSLSHLNKVYYSSSWLKADKVSQTALETDSNSSIEKITHLPQNCEIKSEDMMHNSDTHVEETNARNESNHHCEQTPSHSGVSMSVLEEQQYIEHPANSDILNVVERMAESRTTSGCPSHVNYEFEMEEENLDGTYSNKEQDMLKNGTTVDETKSIGTEGTLDSQDHELENQTNYHNIKNMQLNDTMMSDSIDIDFSERVSEESKQMIELLKSIRPDSVDSSYGGWTPKRKDSEIMSLLSFSSLDGQYLKSLDDISSNEETISIYTHGRVDYNLLDSKNSKKFLSDSLTPRITENSPFQVRKTSFPEVLNKGKVPFISSGFDTSEFKLAEMLEDKDRNNDKLQIRKSNSLTPIGRVGFSLHLPQKKKIDWMLENNRRHTGRMVDKSIKDAKYKANQLQLVKSNCLALYDNFALRNQNAGNTSAFTNDHCETHFIESDTNEIKTTGLKLTKANLDRLAMELKYISTGKNRTADMVDPSTKNEHTHPELVSDTKLLSDGIILLKECSEEHEKNIHEIDSKHISVAENKFIVSTFTDMNEGKYFCVEDVPGQFCEPFDIQSYINKDDANPKANNSGFGLDENGDCLKTLENQELPVLVASTNDNNCVDADNVWSTREYTTINGNSESFPITGFYSDKLTPISEEHRSFEKSEKETESDFNDSLTVDSLDNFDQEMKAWANKYLTKYDSQNGNLWGGDKVENVDSISEQASILDLKEFELSTSIAQPVNEHETVEICEINRKRLSSSSSSSSSDSITYVFVGTDDNVVKESMATKSHYSSMISSVSLDSLEKTAFYPKFSTCLSPRTLSIDSLVAEELFQQLCNNDLLQVQNKFVNHHANKVEIKDVKGVPSNIQASGNTFRNNSKNIHFTANIPELNWTGANQPLKVHSLQKEMHKISDEDNCQTEILPIDLSYSAIEGNSNQVEDESLSLKHRKLIRSPDNEEKTNLSSEVVHEPLLAGGDEKFKRKESIDISKDPLLTKSCQTSYEQCLDCGKRCEPPSSLDKYTQTGDQITRENCTILPNATSTTNDVLQLTSRFMEFMTEMIQYIKRDRHCSRPRQYGNQKHSCNCKHSYRKSENNDTTSDSNTSLTNQHLFVDESVPGVHSGRNWEVRHNERCLRKRKGVPKKKALPKQHKIANTNAQPSPSREQCYNMTFAEQTNICKQPHSPLPEGIQTGNTRETSSRQSCDSKYSPVLNLKLAPECDNESRATALVDPKCNNTLTSFSEISQKSPKHHLKNLVEIRRRIIQETKHLDSQDELSKQYDEKNSIIRFHRKGSTGSTSTSEGYLSSLSSHTARSSYSDNQVPHISSFSEGRHNVINTNSQIRTKPLYLNLQAEVPASEMPSTSWQNTSADSGAFFMDSPLREKLDLDFTLNNIIATNKKNSEKMVKATSPELNHDITITRRNNSQEDCKPSTSTIKYASISKDSINSLPRESTCSTNRKLPFTLEEFTHIHPTSCHLSDSIDMRTLDNRNSTSTNSCLETDSDYSKSNMARIDFAKKLSDSNYKLTKEDIEKILLSIEADKKFLRRRRNPILDRAYSPEINLYSSSSSQQSLFSCSSYKKLPNPTLYLTPFSSGLAS